MTAPELTPCPFCGGEAHLEKGPSAYSVECATGSSCIGSGLLIGFMHDALDRAVTQWNTRTDLTQAAIAAAMMGAVKPLEWGGDYGRSALNPWGGYHITDRAGPNQDYDWFGWAQSSRADCDGSEEDYPTIEAAKAAAESDWQARILSTLSIPTDAMAALEAVKAQVRDEALGEAVAELKSQGHSVAADTIAFMLWDGEGGVRCHPAPP